MNEPQSSQNLFFDPDQHPEGTLKAFEKFTQMFQLRYNAQYPEPPKVSLDAAIECSKFANRLYHGQIRINIMKLKNGMYVCKYLLRHKKLKI